MAEVKHASEAARSGAEGATFLLRARWREAPPSELRRGSGAHPPENWKNVELLVHFILPRGTFGNKE